MCWLCCAIAASWTCVLLLGFTHSQYWWTSSGVRSIGCLGAVVVCALTDTWHFGVGIHICGSLGGGSRACRVFGLRIGRGSFGLFLGMQTVEFISAIFSPIGAILTELQPFSCF